LNIGDLVESEKAFSGIGKLVAIDESDNVGAVAFFESPLRSECRKVKVRLSDLVEATIYDEATVHCLDHETGIWRRARYGSRRPNGDHLIIFKRGQSAVIPIDQLYILNLSGGAGPNPLEFLEARCTDTPFFSDLRSQFVRSYIEQRAACRSLSSILSSSVEIEPHQIAVVRRVLEDDTQKYLLADEVGLGKTIEACLIVREHVLKDERSALVVIGVPTGLIEQWRFELTSRFYLGDLLDNKIFVCNHEQLAAALKIAVPTMIVLDEAHQISPWAWSDVPEHTKSFAEIAAAATAAETLLLLSGTPLSGNEENFLAMLHLLSPETYPLTEDGRLGFLKRVSERERLGGIYQALVTSNDNDTLTDMVEEIAALFSEDKNLLSLIAVAKPLIDWQASQEGQERSAAIANLRSYIGENFRLHQRMLRNRREDPAISQLFPGLAGATNVPWSVDTQLLAIDQILDAYRDEHFRTQSRKGVVNSRNLIEWLELYMISPMLVSARAKHLLKRERDQLAQHEVELLDDLVFCGESEQEAKDKLLSELLVKHFKDNNKSKVIVFCSNCSVADHVSDLLVALFGDVVERHDPKVIPEFSTSDSLRVFVCDQRGEDGLNLHGGHKFLVHYSVPLSFAKIEQRNGRVNRYSATIFARPIPSAVLLPNRTGIFTHWVDVLGKTVRIFDQSVASLQYVLQDKIDEAWRQVVEHGLQPLLILKDDLSGQDGLLERERRKVSAQEELNSMNEEVERAVEFARALEAADEVAEAQAEHMLGWITKGLHFEQKAGEVRDSFRIRYSVGGVRAPRTLVDVMSFIEKCITGIDKDKSDWSEPVTSLMSPDRELVSHGENVYPLRYGQPFVDTIYDLSRSDTRGICSTLIRAVAGIRYESPKVFFRFSWTVTACEPDASPRIQRLADQKYAPRFITHWLNEAGESVKDDFLEAILECPYSKTQTRIGREIHYRDVNVGHQYWDELEDHFPKGEWAQFIQAIGKAAHSLVTSDSLKGTEVNGVTPNAHLEALTAVILIGA
jgi:ATP-dependent helicase HepA